MLRSKSVISTADDKQHQRNPKGFTSEHRQSGSAGGALISQCSFPCPPPPYAERCT